MKFTDKELRILHSVLDHALEDFETQGWALIDVWEDDDWLGKADAQEIGVLHKRLAKHVMGDKAR